MNYFKKLEEVKKTRENLVRVSEFIESMHDTRIENLYLDLFNKILPGYIDYKYYQIKQFGTESSRDFKTFGHIKYIESSDWDNLLLFSTDGQFITSYKFESFAEKKDVLNRFEEFFIEYGIGHVIGEKIRAIVVDKQVKEVIDAYYMELQKNDYYKTNNEKIKIKL